jgi:hypothetical protein
VLCPGCRAERAKDSRPLGEKVLSDYDLTWKYVFRLLLGDAKRLFIASVLITLPILYFLIGYHAGPKFFSEARRIGRRCSAQSTALARIRAGGGDPPAGYVNPFVDTGEFAQALMSRFGEGPAREMLILLMDGQTTLCRDFQKLCLEEGQTEFCRQLARGLS